MEDNKAVKKYMNPYLAGFILGLSLLAALYFTGRGLGASGAVKSTVTTVVNTIAPEHAQDSHFYGKYIKGGKNPMNAWLVFEILGVLFGGLISGALSGRLKFTIEHSPKITAKTRIIFAIAGGFFVGIGASLGRGCASGAAMSGMAVLSTAGFISFMAIFGGAFIFAYFFRKLWI